MKDYNVMIVGQNVFDQPVKNNKITYSNILKITIGLEVDCTSGCLLSYPYLNEYYKMIAIDFNKKQVLDADPKAMQQTNLPKT